MAPAASSLVFYTNTAKAIKNATEKQNGCNFAVSRLEEEAGKCMGNQTTTGESSRTWSMTYLCDEVLIKVLLQQIQRQLTDINLLIAAAQR